MQSTAPDHDDTLAPATKAARRWVPFCVAIALTGCGPAPDAGPTGEHALAPPATDDIATAASATSGAPMQYHGGRLMTGKVSVYLVWYGGWSSSSRAILEDFTKSIGASPYYAINGTYHDGQGKHPGSDVVLAGSLKDEYSRGKVVAQADIVAILKSAIATKHLPLDAHGVYFVLTSSDVKQAGFCTAFCGWHTHLPINGTDVAYAWVGNAATQCPASCGVRALGPNGDPGADAMASVIAHELDETVTDPSLDAWSDTTGAENADKCAWTFGTTYKTKSGAVANMKLGTRDFLIQRNWVNAPSGGVCALSASGGG